MCKWLTLYLEREGHTVSSNPVNCQGLQSFRTFVGYVDTWMCVSPGYARAREQMTWKKGVISCHITCPFWLCLWPSLLGWRLSWFWGLPMWQRPRGLVELHSGFQSVCLETSFYVTSVHVSLTWLSMKWEVSSSKGARPGKEGQFDSTVHLSVRKSQFWESQLQSQKFVKPWELIHTKTLVATDSINQNASFFPLLWIMYLPWELGVRACMGQTFLGGRFLERMNSKLINYRKNTKQNLGVTKRLSRIHHGF